MRSAVGILPPSAQAATEGRGGGGCQQHLLSPRKWAGLSERVPHEGRGRAAIRDAADWQVRMACFDCAMMRTHETRTSEASLIVHRSFDVFVTWAHASANDEAARDVLKNR
jgi:hypothetical protein